METRSLILLLVTLLLTASALGQPPALISYQGKLVDSDGVSVSGSHNLQFDIYTSPTGGTSLWTETHSGVTITGGLFGVALGATTAIDPDTLLDANSQLWLQVTMDGTETFTRTQLLSASYALVATRLSGVDATAAQLNELVGGGATTLHSHAPGDADTLDTLNSTQFLRADANATYSGGTLQVAGGSTLDVAGTFQLGGATVNATAAQLNELVSGGATTLHSHAPGDADTLDTLDSTQFLRSDANDTCAGVIGFTGTTSGISPLQAAVYIQPSINSPGDSLFGIYKDASNMVSINDPGDLTVSGVIQGGTILIPAGYNRFGNSTPSSAQIADKNDLLVSDDLEVKGNLIWAAKTSTYSVAPGEFNPRDEGYTFFCGAYLQNDDGSGTQYWVTSADLPDGAIVQKLTFYVKDADSALGRDLSMDLIRQDPTNGTVVTMASVSVTGSPNWSSDSDTSITQPTIGNEKYHYYLYLTFPGGGTSFDLRFYGAAIEYQTTAPH